MLQKPHLLIVVLALIVTFPAVAFALFDDAPIYTFTVEDDGDPGTIEATAIAGNILYIGGHFDEFYQSVGQGLAFSVDTSEIAFDDRFPQVAGGSDGVKAVVSDGSGGWYIGGDFSLVGDDEIIELAHILPNGDFDDSFDMGVVSDQGECNGGGGGDDSTVYTLALEGSTLYVGGHFTQIGGLDRHCLAAIDISDNTVLPFNPDINNIVYTVFPDDGIVYAGGDFTEVNGGTARNFMAAFDSETGTVTSFDPDISNAVYAITKDTSVADNNVVYAGGNFSTVNGSTDRLYLAAIDTITSLAVEDFDPAPNDVVRALAIGNNNLYVGGNFDTIGGEARNRVAVLTPDGSVDAFDAGLSNSSTAVFALALSDDDTSLYLAGYGLIDSDDTTQLSVLGVNALTGAHLDFDSGLDPVRSNVKSLAFADGELYVGGSLRGETLASRKNLAAIDMSTGLFTDFQHDTDDYVHALLLDDTTLYVGGSFGCLGYDTEQSNCDTGVSAFGLGAIDLEGDTVTDFAPSIFNGEGHGNVSSLAIIGTTLYVGGELNSYVQAFDTTTGDGVAFDPGFVENQTDVYALAENGTALYVGGAFSVLPNGVPVGGAAFVDDAGLLDSFPIFNGAVNVVISDGDGGWYVGGGFSEVTLSDGISTTTVVIPELVHIFSDKTIDETFDLGVFTPDLESVHDLILDGTTLYIAGDFIEVLGEDRFGLASIDLTDNSLLPFNPALNSSANINSIVLDDGVIYAGGDFSCGTYDYNANSCTEVRGNAAAFDALTGETLSFDPGLNNEVFDMVIDGTVLYVGGSFTRTDTVTAVNTLIAETNDGSVYASPQTNGTVYASVSDGAGGWYVGGAFTQIGEDSRDGLAHILSNRSVDPDFNPVVGSTVYALAFDGTTLYAGGTFVFSQGMETRNYVAAFDGTTGALESFDPQVNDNVYALLLDGTTLYVGGAFTQVNGATTRNKLAAFDTADGIATSFDPNVSGESVRSLALEGTTLYIGGQFIDVNGVTNRNNLAALDTGTGLATAFDVEVGGTVETITVGDGVLYIGGGFFSVEGELHTDFAAIDLGTEAILFDAGITSPPETVHDTVLSEDGSIIYLGGGFQVGESLTYYMGLSLDATDGSLLDFPPFHSIGTDDTPEVFTLSAADGNLFVGGLFSDQFGTSRDYIAGFDIDTGSTTPFAVEGFDQNREVRTLALDGTTLYLGGDFTYDNGVANRQNLAAFDTTDSSFVDELVFVPSDTVYTLALDGTTLYAGGNFSGVTNTSTDAFSARAGTLAINTSDWSLLDFDPLSHGTFNFTIQSILPGVDNVVLGGLLDGEFGDVYENLIALDPITAEPVPSFTPTIPYVESLLLDGTALYAGLGFGVRMLDSETGATTTDTATTDSTVYALGVDGTTLYVGGGFSSINDSFEREGLGALSTVTGLPAGFDPLVSPSPVYAFSFNTELLGVGGYGFLDIFGIDDGIDEHGDDDDDDSSDDDSGDDDDDDDNGSGGGDGGGHRKPLLNQSPFLGGNLDIIALLTKLRDLLKIFIGLGGTVPAGADQYLIPGNGGQGACLFARDLTLNDTGDDVKCLQEILIKQNKGPAAQALAVNGSTSFFGGLTQAALAEFQMSVGIVPPAGYFGVLTRAYLNSL